MFLEMIYDSNQDIDPTFIVELIALVCFLASLVLSIYSIKNRMGKWRNMVALAIWLADVSAFLGYLIVVKYSSSIITPIVFINTWSTIVYLHAAFTILPILIMRCLKYNKEGNKKRIR